MSRMKRLKASLTGFPDVAAPPLWLTLAEGRAVFEYVAGLSWSPVLKHLVPKGDGHPVLVLPGLGATDLSTAPLRRFLDSIGYVSHPWGMGRNKGINETLPARMERKLQQIYEQHGQKVSLVGQSLGGVFARELSKLDPARVRQVISLGSPFAGHPLATNGAYLYEWLSSEDLDKFDFKRHHEIRIKPPVPTTSIFSRFDGIVAWPCSIETGRPEGESINVRGVSHCGMGFAPTTFYLLAKRLAQPAGRWTPFQPNMAERLFFGVSAE